MLTLALFSIKTLLRFSASQRGGPSWIPGQFKLDLLWTQ